MNWLALLKYEKQPVNLKKNKKGMQSMQSIAKAIDLGMYNKTLFYPRVLHLDSKTDTAAN